MAISKQEFSGYIKDFNFRELFNVMGWDNDRGNQPITVNDKTYMLEMVAHKRGFRILVCPVANDSPTTTIPDYNTRKKIENKVTPLFQEHLIIFVDNRKLEQIWQLVVRQTGQPTKVTETRYHVKQDPELLYQKASGLFFSLDEEENITIVDVTQRVDANFHQNADRVTRQFYERFKKEHTAFLSFIEGIGDMLNKQWYASLMMNRLMFCYFIQKKGFLDNNRNYLREKLNACRVSRGRDQFYSFYRDFLLVLFHEGLNSINHSLELRMEIGRIPYLNGGLFDEHEIEINHQINIRDKAFENLFNFFDQYEWHLDTRINATGREVNPDVIGYIFEKYINDRANMGAYYTKEDITEYISKSIIIPYLFEETQRQYPRAFSPDGEIWGCLKHSGNTYVYDAVKHGINPENVWADLPNEVADCLDPDQPDLVEKRKAWNQPASPEIALPTEIYREVIERRKRYLDVHKKVESGQVNTINDLITYNLNIRQFAQDIIENTADPDFLKHFYKAINSVTILDPTCGSGAFLFAAMNILEPLYEACIRRMRAFVQDEDRLNESNLQAFSNRFLYFRAVLAETRNEHHPNLEYFIYKSIILNNLYGVDIMKEAVEIAKLRLFLKLVATVDADYRKPNLGLEPLPDIDFNIRSGNTLVGFATEKELEKCLVEDLMGAIVKQEIEESCDRVARAFTHYKEIQLGGIDNFEDFHLAKAELNQRLSTLNQELNRLLHNKTSKLPFEQWLCSHQPFHWFAEFYEIIQEKGGFDCIIGNPPYVEYSRIRRIYTINGYSSISSGNLYSFIIERAIKIQKDETYNGMIIPLSAYCTDRMDAFQRVQFSNGSNLHLSFFAERPSKLFEGAERNLAIAIFKKKENEQVFSIKTTYYYKWRTSFREFLFNNISFHESKESIVFGIVPKISSGFELSILRTLRKTNKNIGLYTSRSRTQNVLFYRNSGGRYWKIIADFQPKFYLNGNEGVSSRESYLFFNDGTDLSLAIAVLNSSLFYWYYIMHSDARTNNPSDLKGFPVDFEVMSESTKRSLVALTTILMKDLKSNSIMQSATYRTGDVVFQQFFPQSSKTIIDQIDTVLAEHYGFTQEELDFIINYDIKFRMGSELNNGGEEV